MPFAEGVCFMMDVSDQGGFSQQAIRRVGFGNLRSQSAARC